MNGYIEKAYNYHSQNKVYIETKYRQAADEKLKNYRENRKKQEEAA